MKNGWATGCFRRTSVFNLLPYSFCAGEADYRPKICVQFGRIPELVGFGNIDEFRNEIVIY